MPRPTFADPKTDFVFKRIFGSEPHKHLLIELLNALLELEERPASSRRSSSTSPSRPSRVPR